MLVRIVLAALCVGLELLGLVGNLLVCVAICTDRHLRKLQNFFLFSMAVADMAVNIAVMPLSTMRLLSPGRWPLGAVVCKLWIAADIAVCTVSILHLSAVSIERFLLIKFPLHYRRILTRSRVTFSILVIWAVGIFMSALPISLDWHTVPPPSPGNQSAENSSDAAPAELCDQELNAVYAVLSSTISFFIPGFAMLFVYVKIYRMTRRHADATRQLEMRSEYKAMRTVSVIVGVFIVCWMPFFTINIVQPFCQCVSPVAYDLITWLGYANSTMNPIIYSVFNMQFRRAFARTFQKCFKCWRPFPALTNSTPSHFSGLRALENNHNLSNDDKRTARLLPGSSQACDMPL